MRVQRNVACVWNCPSRAEVGPPHPVGDQQSLWVLYHGSIVPSRLPSTLVAALVLPALSFAQSKPTVRPADYGKWETLTLGGFGQQQQSPPNVLSPNGQWLAYGVNRVSEENELRVGATGRDTTIVVAYGSAPAFTGDSRWLVYAIGVSPAERDKLTRDKKPIHNSAGVRIEGQDARNNTPGVVSSQVRQPSPDAVQEVAVQTSNYAAELGTAGGAVINMVMKSGTNQFHGSGYDYFRNTVLDARNFFAATRPTEHQNEFGATFGGPVKKNRIFFFSAYDGFRKRTLAQPTFYSLPTLRERTGDFGEFPTTIYDPQTTNCANGPCTRQPYRWPGPIPGR